MIVTERRASTPRWLLATRPLVMVGPGSLALAEGTGGEVARVVRGTTSFEAVTGSYARGCSTSRCRGSRCKSGTDPQP